MLFCSLWLWEFLILEFNLHFTLVFSRWASLSSVKTAPWCALVLTGPSRAVRASDYVNTHQSTFSRPRPLTSGSCDLSLSPRTRTPMSFWTWFTNQRRKILDPFFFIIIKKTTTHEQSRKRWCDESSQQKKERGTIAMPQWKPTTMYLHSVLRAHLFKGV